MLVKDWEGNVCIGGIDVLVLIKDVVIGVDLIDLMIEGSFWLNIGFVNEGKIIIYVNCMVMFYLCCQVCNVKNVQLFYEQVLGWDGKECCEFYFDGFLVYQIDVLLMIEVVLFVGFIVF